MARTWFITGASRGLGVEIAKAALRAGDNVVATGRKHADLEASLGTQSGPLLTLEQDVTNTEQALSTAAAAVKRFGSIDVLVNNAGYGHLGFFEETSEQDVMAQYATNVFGLLTVTRAILRSELPAVPFFKASEVGLPFGLTISTPWSEEVDVAVRDDYFRDVICRTALRAVRFDVSPAPADG